MDAAKNSKLQMRVGRAAHAHYAAANRFVAWDRAATAVAIFGGILLLVAGIYAGFLADSSSAWGPWVGAALTVASMVLVGFSIGQAVWRWGYRAEQHRQAAARFAAVRREIEAALDDGTLSGERLKALNDAVSVISDGFPMPPEDIWKRSKAAYSKENRE